MNRIKVEILKAIITMTVSAVIAYVIYRSFGLFFESVDSIDKLMELVVK